MRPFLLCKCLAIALCGLSCSGSPIESNSNSVSNSETGTIQASIDGATFLGTGIFSSDRDLRLGLEGKFTFRSDGRGESDGETIYGVWFGGAYPPAGTYELVPPDWENHDGLWLFYKRDIGQKTELYAAESGSFDVVASSPDEVRGSFRARAWWICTMPTPLPCPDLSGEVTSTRIIDISGSFVLIPWVSDFEPL